MAQRPELITFITMDDALLFPTGFHHLKLERERESCEQTDECVCVYNTLMVCGYIRARSGYDVDKIMDDSVK